MIAYMIGYIKGKIIHQDLKSIILDVSGIGYKIYTAKTFLNPDNNKNVDFWTYLAVRENALDLYGFETKEELDFFELLISVSGIGPKSAIGIMTVASVQNLKQAIGTGDTTHLIKFSGVGKKNAEKIVLELKDKIQGLNVDIGKQLSEDMDALEALTTLGYGEREIREALKKVSNIENTKEKIKKALKLLS